MRGIGFTILLTLLWTSAAHAAGLPAQAEAVLQALELKELPTTPAWADRTEPPLFTFAWISDTHVNEGNLTLIHAALKWIDQEIAPDFVLVTGDNCGWAPAGAWVNQPLPVRRHRFFQHLLDDTLRCPAVVIPGDNWPAGFETVFGPAQYSFDYGGVHFLLTSPDRVGSGEGASGFEPTTWDWMKKDLSASAGKPTVVALHEPVLPPSFVEAGAMQAMVEADGEVVAVLQGHLHRDLAFTDAGIRYLTCPALGPHPSHPFKIARVYRDAIVFQTIAWQAGTKQFQPTRRWTLVPIPEPLREGLHRPVGGFAMHNPRTLAPHGRRRDRTLDHSNSQLVVNLMRFMLSGAATLGSQAPAD